MDKEIKKLEEILEPGIKKLVMLLREYGFNTFCSCGHKPAPYIQMECYADNEITKLYTFLIMNGYDNFSLRFQWDTIANRRYLEVTFNPLQEVKRVVEKEEK